MSIADSNIQDDGYNPDAQVSGRAEMLLMPGVYKVNAVVRPRMQDGEEVIEKDADGTEWPKYVIPSFEVEQPSEESGRFTVWHDIATRPTNFGDETKPKVSEAAIFLKAVDPDAAQTCRTFGEVAEKIKEMANSGQVSFTVSTGLTARDSAWAKSEIARLNLSRENGDGKEISKIWRKANQPTKLFLVTKATKVAPA